MILLLLVDSQTAMVLVNTAGVEGISSHSPHSQQGSVFVMMTGGGMDIASHSGHGSAYAAT